MAFSFDKLVVAYVDREDYSELPHIKPCFESIKETFPEATFINIPDSYDSIVKSKKLKITAEWSALYTRFEYIKSNPDQYIISIELDVYINDKQKIRNFVETIFTQDRTFYFGSDAFVLAYNASDETNQLLNCVYSQCKKLKRKWGISTSLLFLKKYPEVKNIEYTGNYLYHIGDIGWVSKTAKKLIIVMDDNPLYLSYIPDAMVFIISAKIAKRVMPYHLIKHKNQYQNFGYWFIHPKMLFSIVSYVKSLNKNIKIETVTTKTFNETYNDIIYPSKFWTSYFKEFILPPVL